VGARLLRVPVDAGGLDPAKLPPAAQRPRLAYVTPCHQFPSGVIMPLERRLALLQWASRLGARVVEDDYVSEFRYEGQPLEALQSLDRDERAISMGSFSKALFPALRVGYLVLPSALVRPFLAAKWAADRFSALLYQEALAELVTSGQAEIAFELAELL
jgi:GntR family transcriptional regulator/MocR family aminotransferase